jgi:hypothetical protein
MRWLHLIVPAVRSTPRLPARSRRPPPVRLAGAGGAAASGVFDRLLRGKNDGAR